MVSPETIMRLYKAYILPHFEYCSPVLLEISKTLASKLEDTNYYMLRTLVGLAKSNTHESVLHYADMKSLIHCRHLQSLVLLFRCLKGQGPTYLEDFFRILLTPYNLRGYGTKVDQPRFTTKWAKNSFCSIISRLWNHLPDSDRNADNINFFKNILNNIDLDIDIFLT